MSYDEYEKISDWVEKKCIEKGDFMACEVDFNGEEVVLLKDIDDLMDAEFNEENMELILEHRKID